MGYWKSRTVPAKKHQYSLLAVLSNQPVPGAIGPVIYGGTAIIWSTVLCFYMGKTVKKSFNGRNLQQMTRVTKCLCLYKNSDPKELSAPAQGLYTCIKT